jgi:hypothetical protein
MPVTPAHRRLRQEKCEFKDSLGYIIRPCLQNKQTNKQMHVLEEATLKAYCNYLRL